MNLPSIPFPLREIPSARRAICLIVLLHCLSVIGRADAEIIRGNPEAQAYVFGQSAKGLDADLADRFPNKADRILDGGFVYWLLTNPNPRIQHYRVSILNAVILGVDLRNADVPMEVSLKSCSFTRYVNFGGSHFKKNLSLTESEFIEGLNLSDVTVDGNLLMREVKVPMEQLVSLVDLRISGELDISSSSFGKAYFANLEVGKNLFASDTYFVNQEDRVDFGSIRIKGRATFSHAEFLGPVNFQLATIGTTLLMTRARFESTDPQDPNDFRSMTIGGNFGLSGAVFAGPADFEHTEVAYQFYLFGTRFEGTTKRTSFINMKADLVDFSEAKFAMPYDVGGMQYREVVTENDPTSFVANSVFSSDAYGNLEASLKRQGKEALANSVYIAQKRRERAGLSYPGKVASVFLDVLVGYGRRPWLAFVWSVLFVLIGYVVFRRRHGMSPTKPEHAERPYSPFLYSLDLFLPFVNLRADDFWEPCKERRFARAYAAFHTLLGWILIPIGLAAVSGLIR